MAATDLFPGSGQPGSQTRTLVGMPARVLRVPAATMAAMRASRFLAPLTLAVAVAMSVAACGGDPSPAATSAPAASVAATKTPRPTSPAAPTAVPGTKTPKPKPSATPPTTTDTSWGTILDQVPDTFPVYPGAEPTDLVDGPASGAWLAPASVAKAAAWYRAALEDAGFRTVNLSSPLEDGSQVLDSVSGAPGCAIQAAFRPSDGSTMISVLFGAGCAGG